MSRIASNFKGYDNIFSVRLRQLFDKSNITQQQLADETECSRQAISQYLDGSNAPNVEKLANIAKYFGVSVDYLLGLTDITTADIKIKAMSEYIGLSEKAIKGLEDLCKTFKDENILLLTLDYCFYEPILLQRLMASLCGYVCCNMEEKILNAENNQDKAEAEKIEFHKWQMLKAWTDFFVEFAEEHHEDYINLISKEVKPDA